MWEVFGKREKCGFRSGSLFWFCFLVLLEFPNFHLSHNARDTLKQGDDKPMHPILIGLVVDEILIKHSDEGKKEVKKIRPKSLIVAGFCLNGCIFVHFGKEPLNIEGWVMEDWFVDGAWRA